MELIFEQVKARKKNIRIVKEMRWNYGVVWNVQSSGSIDFIEHVHLWGACISSRAFGQRYAVSVERRF